MVDMPDLPAYIDIPYGIRKSPRKRWNLFKDLMDGTVVYDPETKTFSEVGSSNAEEPAVENPAVEPEVEQPATRDIHIDITDGTDGIEGATVVIGETSKTTGSAGGCNFTGLTDGEKSVTVTAEGYTEKTETITVSENDTSFTITLTEVEAVGES